MSFKILAIALGLLMVDAIIEVGFLGSMVGYLHQAHGNVPFQVNNPHGNFTLYPKPKHLIVSQGYTSIGAACTAFVFVGIIGCVVLWLQTRRERMESSAATETTTQNIIRRPSRIILVWAIPVWAILNILSFLLTMIALIYTFTVTHQTDHQTISLSVAVANSGLPYPNNEWTPENWYKQVLTLPFANPSEKSSIKTHVRLMSGWRWNLIPMFILGLVITSLATMEAVKEWRPRQGDTERDLALHADRTQWLRLLGDTNVMHRGVNTGVNTGVESTVEESTVVRSTVEESTVQVSS
jgi:hypothetical protein